MNVFSKYGVKYEEKIFLLTFIRTYFIQLNMLNMYNFYDNLSPYELVDDLFDIILP